MDAKLVKALAHPDPDTGLANAKRLATQLDKSYPSAASSLREGLEQMFDAFHRRDSVAAADRMTNFMAASDNVG